MIKAVLAITAVLVSTGATMAVERIRISSQWGEMRAEVTDSDAGAAFLAMLPLTIEMSDHMRQEKTGNLPSDIPPGARQQEFNAGTLGVWSNDDFVIYYRAGRVPQPGIRILGQVEGDVTSLDQPGEVTVQIERLE